MNKIKVERENKVFVYGNPYLSECTKEENILFFDKTVDPLMIIKNHREFNSIKDYINTFLNNKKNNLTKITTTLSLSLFIALNPNTSTALSYLNTLSKISSTGEDLISAFATGVIKGVSIITVVRLFNELMNGGNEYRLFEILKECLGVILAVIIIPKVPLIISMIID